MSQIKPKIPIGQLQQFKSFDIDMKTGTVWQFGRSFFQVVKTQENGVKLRVIKDCGDIVRKRDELVITEADVDNLK